MKMKKILNEWRRFVVNEGASNQDIRQKEIDRINNSELKDSEAQKQIASIYLPMSLAGHTPIGAKEFYSGRILDSDVVSMLETLSIDIYNHSETGKQTTESEYFTIETVGELAKDVTTDKIRIRSNNTSAAQGIFDNTDDLQKRIYTVQKMISQGDLDFSKLSSFSDYTGTTKGGHHRGPNSGNAGIQLPGNLTPAETAEFETMMEMYSQAHSQLFASIGKEKNRAHYQTLQSAYEKQKKFYMYMYEMWSAKKGEANPMTAMYKSAAMEEEYGEMLQVLINSPEMQSQFEKEKMSDTSTLDDDFLIGSTTTDKQELEQIIRKFRNLKDLRWRQLRPRLRML
jgi:tellurite resistance protein